MVDFFGPGAMGGVLLLHEPLECLDDDENRSDPVERNC